MKTYLIKKEIKSVWKWALIAMVIQFICFIFSEIYLAKHSIFEVPYLMMTGKLAGGQSPLLGLSSFVTYFWVISLLTGIVCAVVQIYPEIQNKTMPFLMHRPVTKGEILNAKIVSGLAMLVASNGVPLGFIILTCSIPGNYAAPFEIGMSIEWILIIYCACCVYLAVLNCCIQEGKFLKWVTLLSLIVFFTFTFTTVIFLSVWLMVIVLFVAILIWYLTVKHSFDERDFS